MSVRSVAFLHYLTLAWRDTRVCFTIYGERKHSYAKIVPILQPLVRKRNYIVEWWGANEETLEILTQLRLGTWLWLPALPDRFWSISQLILDGFNWFWHHFKALFEPRNPTWSSEGILAWTLYREALNGASPRYSLPVRISFSSLRVPRYSHIRDNS